MAFRDGARFIYAPPLSGSMQSVYVPPAVHSAKLLLQQRGNGEDTWIRGYFGLQDTWKKSEKTLAIWSWQTSGDGGLYRPLCVTVRIPSEILKEDTEDKGNKREANQTNKQKTFTVQRRKPPV